MIHAAIYIIAIAAAIYFFRNTKDDPSIEALGPICIFIGVLFPPVTIFFLMEAVEMIVWFLSTDV